MKKRNGFVSNSSSSSFVLIGFKVADNYTWTSDIDGLDHVWCSSNGLWAGKRLANISDEDPVTFKAFNEAKIQELFAEIRKIKPDADIQLIIGEESL